jgi:uncharacterized protein (TIGR03435 family)
MAVSPPLRAPLQLAGFLTVRQALEEQLGLELVPATTHVPTIVIDEIHPLMP